MVRIREASSAELDDRRRQVLRELGVSYDELKAHARSYSLVGDEWAAWEEIRDIEFLLSGE